MSKLLSANFMRVSKSRLFRAGLIVTVGYCLFLLLINYFEKAAHIGNSIVQAEWYLLSPFSVIVFFCPIFSSIFIGTDYSDNTIRNKLTVGYTRKEIYLTNFITICLSNLLITAITTIVVAVIGTILFHWKLTNTSLFTLYYFSGLLMLIAFSGLFTFMAMLIQGKAISSITCILTFLLSYLAESIIRTLVLGLYEGIAVSEQFSFLSDEMISQTALEWIYDFLPTGQSMQITSGIVLNPLRLPLCSLLFTSVTVSFGLIIFCRKDLK